MASQQRVILETTQIDLILKRLCLQLIENHDNFSNTSLIGLQPRGAILAERLHHLLGKFVKDYKGKLGVLDTTFYRDDFRRREKPLEANSTKIEFVVEKNKVVFVDDVLYTGRSVRAGMDALLAFGRPASVELLVLIDRRYSRHLPIQPDYLGHTIDSISTERVDVKWKESDGKDEVILKNI